MHAPSSAAPHHASSFVTTSSAPTSSVASTGGILPPCILAFLETPDKLLKELPPQPLTLVYPTTPAVASFCNDHLSPFISRDAGNLFGDYEPLLSRGGLVLLCRRLHVNTSHPDLCVYDPVTSHRTFLSEPPGIPFAFSMYRKYVLLTAVDGIECSFKLFVGDLDQSSGPKSGTPHVIKVQIFNSSTGAWGPVVAHEDLIPLRWLEVPFHAVVLHGGVIHWLQRNDNGGNW